MEINNIKKYILFIIVVAILVCVVSIIFYMKSKVEYVNQKIKLNIGNENINLSYSKAVDISDGTRLMVYQDSKKDEYIFKNNKLVGYLKNRKITEKKEKSKEIKKYTIKDFKSMPMLKDINFDGYVFDGERYIDSYNETEYVYIKYINGIKTNDSISISFTDDGKISSFDASRAGLFNNLKTNVTKEKVEKYVEEYIKEMQKNGKIGHKDNSPINYEIDYMFINVKDNKYFVEVGVVLDNKEYKRTIVVTYDL